ncbi:MAG: hypothetical protein GF308_08185 [Candidatus Heimdallarchaeota archaeon]|nr:hypothetical protein [Candidatus Heimdallarchaeota archaeon]
MNTNPVVNNEEFTLNYPVADTITFTVGLIVLSRIILLLRKREEKIEKNTIV